MSRPDKAAATKAPATRRDRREADPRPWPRRHGWVIGVVLGILAGTGAGVWTWDREQERQDRQWVDRVEAFERTEEVPPPADVVQELVDQDTRIAVAHSLEGGVDAALRAQAEKVVAGAPVTTHIGYLPAPSTRNGYTNSGAPTMWAAAVNEPGHYVVIYDDGTSEVASIAYEEPFLYDVETRGQPGQVLLRMAEGAVEWEPEDLRLKPMNTQDYWGGVGGGVAAVLLFGGFIVVPLFLGLRLLVSLLRKES